MGVCRHTAPFNMGEGQTRLAACGTARHAPQAVHRKPSTGFSTGYKGQGAGGSESGVGVGEEQQGGVLCCIDPTQSLSPPTLCLPLT
jgi:hypothetical protein